MRFDCVCRRPAVSTIATSRPRARAASTASNATAAGSAPRDAPTKSAPARSAQISSCSSAAARNVSAAPTSTERPCSVQLPRELADRRRLPGAVHADDEHDARGSREVERRRRLRRSPRPPRRARPRARPRHRAPPAAARAPRLPARRRRCESALPRGAPTPRRRWNRTRRSRAPPSTRDGSWRATRACGRRTSCALARPQR